MTRSTERSGAQPAAVLHADPFRPSAHVAALALRGVIAAPLRVRWRYRVVNADAFAAWLSTREILLSAERLALDADLDGLNYGGTFEGSGSGGAPAFQTEWGYRLPSAATILERLAEGSMAQSIVARDVGEFLTGLKRFISEAGPRHFTQETLVAAAVRRE